MVEEFEFSISKVDPNKKIATQTFRLNSHGEQRGKIVSLLLETLKGIILNFVAVVEKMTIFVVEDNLIWFHFFGLLYSTLVFIVKT
jgi:hypothetical protein